MGIKVTILGSNSAIPTLRANPTAQIINIDETLMLMDCGEGTQLRLREQKVSFEKISYIFISHLHGDHYFGLIGLLSSMHLFGRTTEIHLFGHNPLLEIIQLQLKCANTKLNYPLHFHSITEGESAKVFDHKKFEVSTFPLDHRIPSNGYLFKEKPKGRRINKAACDEKSVPFSYFKLLKQGEDIQLMNGTNIKNEELTFDPLPEKSYAFCSDTRYCESIVPHIKGVDLLYHESTFLERHEDHASSKFHSTAKEAARIAKQAGAGRLLLGHFSSRYKEKDEFLVEAGEIFPNCSIATEGKEFKV